jgi:hypothetical protein
VRWEGIWPALQSSRVRDQPTGEQPIAIARTRWPRASRNRLIQHSSSRAYVWTCGGGIKIEKATEDTAWLMPRRPRPAALGAAALHVRGRHPRRPALRFPSRASVTQIARAHPCSIALGLGPRAALPRDPPCGCCGRGEARDENWWYPYGSTRERSAGTPDRQRKKAVVTLFLLHCSNVKLWQTGSAVCSAATGALSCADT